MIQADGPAAPRPTPHPQEHRAHHLPPISDHYCILSGVWNAPLDGSGVLRALERAIYAATGVAPRSWDATHYAGDAREAGGQRQRESGAQAARSG
jgi:hypothetical protein